MAAKLDFAADRPAQPEVFSIPARTAARTGTDYSKKGRIKGSPAFHAVLPGLQSDGCFSDSKILSNF